MTFSPPRQRRERSDAPRPQVRALGIDPGLTRTGWALVAQDGPRYRLLDSGVIAPRSDAGADDLPGRLADGYLRMVGVLELAHPTVVAVEDLFTTPKFPKSALKMAHLRGVYCLAVAQAGVPLLALTATTVKQRLTGNGHASKEQVQRMVFELCAVDGAGIPNDLSDAIGLAIAGLHQMSYNALTGRGLR
ncbi:MAG: crossover junction endodeoxyribonuclease RuvC [Chloroflexi bacterium]|nr:crossover junction endodeoxyribonuclease RuvC [Chloroflexota bacterium]